MVSGLPHAVSPNRILGRSSARNPYQRSGAPRPRLRQRAAMTTFLGFRPSLQIRPRFRNVAILAASKPNLPQ
jgi:hypothetical protein